MSESECSLLMVRTYWIEGPLYCSSTESCSSRKGKQAKVRNSRVLRRWTKLWTPRATTSTSALVSDRPSTAELLSASKEPIRIGFSTVLVLVWIDRTETAPPPMSGPVGSRPLQAIRDTFFGVARFCHQVVGWDTSPAAKQRSG